MDVSCNFSATFKFTCMDTFKSTTFENKKGHTHGHYKGDFVEALSGYVRTQCGGELKETIKGALCTAAPLEHNHGWIKAWT